MLHLHHYSASQQEASSLPPTFDIFHLLRLLPSNVPIPALPPLNVSQPLRTFAHHLLASVSLHNYHHHPFIISAFQQSLQHNMFLPPPSDIIPTTVRDFNNTPLIALATVLGLFLLLIICLFLCLVFRNIQREHRPLPNPNIHQSEHTRSPIVSRLALADLLGVSNSGTSLSDIDSAAPLFYVDHHDDDSEKGVSDDTCAVCLELLENGQRARRLPCQHVYHDSCAVVWLVKADRCPICAQPVVQTDDQQQEQQQSQQEQQEPAQDSLIVITDHATPRSRPQSRFLPSLFRVRR